MLVPFPERAAYTLSTFAGVFLCWCWLENQEERLCPPSRYDCEIRDWCPLIPREERMKEDFNV